MIPAAPTRACFASQTLAFGCERMLEPALRNALPWVERIYLAVPRYSWHRVRGQRVANPTTGAAIAALCRRLPGGQRIRMVCGDWPSEAEQRNALLQLARQDGFRFCLIHDADEFYSEDSWRQLLSAMQAQADGRHHFTVDVQAFFRDLRYTFANEYGDLAIEHFNVGIDLQAPSHFVRNRQLAGSPARHVPGRCLHLSYVLSDQELRQKVRTWGHARDFPIRPWVDRVWRHWSPWRSNLHPLEPERWKFLVRHRAPLPAALRPLQSWRCAWLRGSLYHELCDPLHDWLTMMRRRGRKRGTLAFACSRWHQLKTLCQNR